MLYWSSVTTVEKLESQRTVRFRVPSKRFITFQGSFGSERQRKGRCLLFVAHWGPNQQEEAQAGT